MARKVIINDSLETKNLEVAGDIAIDAGRIAFVNAGQSIFIGQSAGQDDDLSNNNSVFIGHEAGKANVSGTDNVAIGFQALTNATNSNYNIAVGETVMSSVNMSGNANTGIGNFSLQNLQSGSENLAMGQNSLGALTIGANNVALGNYAGDALTVGGNNVAIGIESLSQAVNGDNNVAIGYGSGKSVAGDANTMIGHEAGYQTTGDANVFLGHKAGRNETGSNKLYVDNSDTGTPLIYGNFLENEVTINDSLTVGKELGVATSTPNSTFEVNGSVAAKFKTPLAAGVTDPDDTGMVWRYNSGTGTITLPSAATCPNRMYVIINQTGATRTISTFRNLTQTNTTTINASVALWVMSDGAEWWQIK